MATYFSCVFVHDAQPGCFGQTLEHDSERAKALFADLEYPSFGYRHQGQDVYTGLLCAPPKGQVSIGAYPHGFIWLDAAFLEEACLSAAFAAEHLARLFPDQCVTALFHEATGMSWLYILTEFGSVKRVHTGHWSTVEYESGDPLPLEVAYWSGGTRADPEDPSETLYVSASGEERPLAGVHISVAFDLYHALLNNAQASETRFPLRVETFRRITQTKTRGMQ